MRNNPLMRARVLALLLLALALFALAGGCVAVKPWERARLSHPCMQMDARLGDAYLAHVLSVREGSVGGEGGAGGGCGCN